MASGYYIKAFYDGSGTDLDTPIGETTIWITDTKTAMFNKGWLPCNGDSHLPNHYPELFKCIGYQYLLPQDVTNRYRFRVPWLDEHGNLIKSCHHWWIQYRGFTDVYEYCKFCDEKKRSIT